MDTKHPTPPPSADNLPVANQDHTKAFNEWMRLYIEQPEVFELQWQTISSHLNQIAHGKKLTYGETCAAFFAKLLEEGNGG